MSDITTMLDDATEDAINEIKRLRSEVFSLRAEVHRLRLENAALIAKPNRGRLELGGGE